MRSTSGSARRLGHLAVRRLTVDDGDGGRRAGSSDRARLGVVTVHRATAQRGSPGGELFETLALLLVHEPHRSVLSSAHGDAAHLASGLTASAALRRFTMLTRRTVSS
ncbi:MAG: hypothetical protein WKF45_03750 [Ilumatobacteraceae bacterium]